MYMYIQICSKYMWVKVLFPLYIGDDKINGMRPSHQPLFPGFT